MIKRNLPPETPIYTGEIKEKTTIIKTVYNKSTIVINNDLTIDEKNTIYFKINGFEDSASIEKLLTDLKIDPLVIEDVFNVTQRSKIEIHDNIIFVVLKTLSKDSNEEVVYEYVSFILVDNIVLSINERQSNLFSHVQTRLQNENSLIRKHKSAFLLYTLMDVIMDKNMSHVKEIEDCLDELEDLALENQLDDNKVLYKYRREINLIRNSVSPFFELNVRNNLLSHSSVSSDVVKYYNDVFDHAYKLSEQLNLGRETLRIIYEIQVNNVSSNMNTIMHTLTIFSVIFIPLSFLSGVFGMNFIEMPLLQNDYGFFVFLGLCAVVITFMIFFFKKRKFF